MSSTYNILANLLVDHSLILRKRVVLEYREVDTHLDPASVMDDPMISSKLEQSVTPFEVF
jgi:hypothetical protein